MGMFQMLSLENGQVSGSRVAGKTAVGVAAGAPVATGVSIGTGVAVAGAVVAVTGADVGAAQPTSNRAKTQRRSP
jgi:hypothetical protein